MNEDPEVKFEILDFQDEHKICVSWRDIETHAEATEKKKEFVSALRLHEMVLGKDPRLHVYTKTEHEIARKNGQMVHLLDGYIKDLELLARLLPTSSIENKEIIKPAVDDVLQRLYKIREAKP